MALKDKLRGMVQKLGRPTQAASGDYGDMPFSADGSDVEQPSHPPFLLRLLAFCLLVGIGMFCFANMKPYLDIVGYLGDFFLSLPLMPFLLQLPLIGWLITTAGGVLQTIFGAILWAILQIFELLPTVMKNNPGFLLAVIAAYRAFRQLRVEAGDNRVIKRLKAKYNSLPTQWLEEAEHYRAIAYAVDALLCFAFYPPIKGGWENMGLFLMAPSFSDLDRNHIILALSSMFLVEAMYRAYRFVSNSLHFFEAGNRE